MVIGTFPMQFVTEWEIVGCATLRMSIQNVKATDFQLREFTPTLANLFIIHMEPERTLLCKNDAVGDRFLKSSKK